MAGPYFQNFESEAFPTFENNPSWNWTISGNTTGSWERATNAASPNLSPIDNGDNSASFRIRSLEFIEAGETHTLMTPGIDLSDLNPPIRAYFDLAYAKRSGNTNDVIEVHVSDDCGRNWKRDGIENVMKTPMTYLPMAVVMSYSHTTHPVSIGSNKA
jgi:hypothetical protein